MTDDVSPPVSWIITRRVHLDNGWTRVHVSFMDGRRAVGLVAPGELVAYGETPLIGVLARVPLPPVSNYVQ